MPNNIKAEFKFSVRIKGCDKVFAEGFEPGEIASQVISYGMKSKEFINGDFFQSVLYSKAQEIMNEEIEVLVERVK